MTIQSTIDLSKHLLENCNFEYVLTGTIFSVYSVLKPPKFSNCTITNIDSPKLSLEDLREILHNKSNERY